MLEESLELELEVKYMVVDTKEVCVQAHLPTHQIVGMGEAFKYARLEMEENTKHVKMLHDRLLNQLTTIEETYINGSLDHKVPNILNISFNFVEGESLMMAIV